MTNNQQLGTFGTELELDKDQLKAATELYTSFVKQDSTGFDSFTDKIKNDIWKQCVNIASEDTLDPFCQWLDKLQLQLQLQSRNDQITIKKCKDNNNDQ